MPFFLFASCDIKTWLSRSETVYFLDSGMDALLVKVGALARVIQNVRLVERVKPAHVPLQRKGRTVPSQSLVLRENVPLDHSAHGHVRAILDRERLQVLPFLIGERAGTHLLSRMHFHILVEGGCLHVSRQAARLRGVSRHASVLVIHHDVMLCFALLFC